MVLESLPFLLSGFLAVAVFSCLPSRFGQDGVAAITAIVLGIFAPATAMIMIASIVLVQLAMVWSERHKCETATAAIAIPTLVFVLLASRAAENAAGPGLGLVGIAYSTLRHIHVLAEWRFGRIKAPSLRAYFRYHLLLPVLIAGPIHRLPHFERQCQRRRWSAREFFAGAERVLIGFTLIIVLGEYLIGAKIRQLVAPAPLDGFAHVWLGSASTGSGST